MAPLQHNHIHRHYLLYFEPDAAGISPIEAFSFFFLVEDVTAVAFLFIEVSLILFIAVSLIDDAEESVFIAAFSVVVVSVGDTSGELLEESLLQAAKQNVNKASTVILLLK